MKPLLVMTEPCPSCRTPVVWTYTPTPPPPAGPSLWGVVVAALEPQRVDLHIDCPCEGNTAVVTLAKAKGRHDGIE